MQSLLNERFYVRFNTNVSVVYNLYDSETTKKWIPMINSMSISDCCKNNHYNGNATEKLIQEKIDRLYALSATINDTVPGRVSVKPITKETWRTSLHEMHTHFPELRNNATYSDIWLVLTEYNDIIHWLEQELESAWMYNRGTAAFKIKLDFNKISGSYEPIPDNDFKMFDPYQQFGDLSLHYTHVGKHAYELYSVNDLVCPPDQFIPQRTFNASVRLQFNNSHNKNYVDSEWEKFYHRRGGFDFFNMNIEDPKLAFGFLKIGYINSIAVNDVEYSIPENTHQMNAFRTLIADSCILNWEVK